MALTNPQRIENMKARRAGKPEPFAADGSETAAELKAAKSKTAAALQPEAEEALEETADEVDGVEEPEPEKPKGAGRPRKVRGTPATKPPTVDKTAVAAETSAVAAVASPEPVSAETLASVTALLASARSVKIVIELS